MHTYRMLLTFYRLLAYIALKISINVWFAFKWNDTKQQRYFLPFDTTTKIKKHFLESVGLFSCYWHIASIDSKPLCCSVLMHRITQFNSDEHWQFSRNNLKLQYAPFSKLNCCGNEIRLICWVKMVFVCECIHNIRIGWHQHQQSKIIFRKRIN